MMPPPLPKIKQPKLSHSPHQPTPAFTTDSVHSNQRRPEHLPLRPPPRQGQAPSDGQHLSIGRQPDESSMCLRQTQPAAEIYQDSRQPRSLHNSQQQSSIQDRDHASIFGARIGQFQYEGDYAERLSYDKVYESLMEQEHPEQRFGLTAGGGEAYQPGFDLSTDIHGVNHTPNHHVSSNITRSPFFKRPAYVEPQASHHTAHEINSRCRGPSPQQSPSMYGLANPTPFAARLREAKEKRPAYIAVDSHEHEGRREFYAPPQTTQGTHGFLQRSNPPLSRMAYGATASPAKTQRSRISLPSTNGLMGTAFSGQDAALSQIQGVRGSVSRQGQPYGPAPSQPFGASRQLFSAAGNRRSVRR